MTNKDNTEESDIHARRGCNSAVCKAPMAVGFCPYLGKDNTNHYKLTNKGRKWIRDTSKPTLESRPKPAPVDNTKASEGENDMLQCVNCRKLTTRVEAELREIKRKFTLHVPLMSSQDYKDGFSDALDQIDKADFERIAVIEGRLAGGLAELSDAQD